MAGGVLGTPTFQLQPAPQKVALATNYISDFNFENQYLPDTEVAEFERYGDRRVAGFLQYTSAEIPTVSDKVIWSEQGRLHVKYTQVGTAGAATDDTAIFRVNDTLDPARASIGLTGGTVAISVGDTVLISQNDASGNNKGVVTAVNANGTDFTVAFYEAGGLITAGTGLGNSDVTVMIYGSEYMKGSSDVRDSYEANPQIFENTPTIMRSKYEVNGSDMAQIGWIESTTEEGDTGYLWYLKSMGETRLRFDDHLETNMIEAVPAATGSGAIVAHKGSEGVFYVVENRGNIYGGGVPETLSDWDSMISRLDNQGSIQENAIFLDRDFGFAIDDMLAAQNSYGAGGTSYGMFHNSEDMALSLGFQGFKRGSYNFYKSDWKYLNDPTMRGNLPSDQVNGLMIPAGLTTVYDSQLGKNAKRPFLHVRYRASEAENRRYKSWVIAGDIAGVANSDIDSMTMQFLSERCVCTMGANNFFIFED